jgi:hypothetical protein
MYILILVRVSPKFLINEQFYILYDVFKFIKNSIYMKHNSKFNIFKGMKFTPKPKFSHLFFSINFNDKF